MDKVWNNVIIPVLVSWEAKSLKSSNVSQHLGLWDTRPMCSQRHQKPAKMWRYIRVDTRCCWRALQTSAAAWRRHQRCVDGVTRVNVRQGGVVSPPGGAPLCHGWTECGWCCAAPAASHLVHLPIRANFELLHICSIQFTFSAHERPTLNKESSTQQQPPLL